MDTVKRLELHLEEAEVHIQRLTDVLSSLEKLYPITNNDMQTLSSTDKDKLDVLAFRFAKLQDLLGTKVFREYLTVLQYPVEDKNFLDILKELDKEKVVDIDLWSEFRGVRNSISHDYPSDEDERNDAINYLIKHIKNLMSIAQTIRGNFETIKQRS